MGTPMIGAGKLSRGQLRGQAAIVTGAGRGIGFETARALAWLGAKAVIAEIDRETGSHAAESINEEMGDSVGRFWEPARRNVSQYAQRQSSSLA